MSKVKNILFKVELKGNGVVNYDSNDQKYMWNGNTFGSGQEKVTHDNVSFAKKRWYKNESGSFDHKLIVSSNCLRHHVFIDDVQFQSPNIINNKFILNSMIASPGSILRGYMFAEKDETVMKRKSPLTITDAEQTNGALSTIETFSRSGEKIQDDNKSDITFFKKETIGDIEYQSIGNIDLKQLQFVSCDQVFDRLALDPDTFQDYKNLLVKRLPSFNSELGYYQINNSIVDIPEYGFLLSNEDCNGLVKGLLNRMLNLNIRNSGSYAEVSSIKIKLVTDVFDNKMSSVEGWIDLDKETIENLDLDIENFYTLYDFETSKILRQELEEKLKEKKKKNADAASKKKEAKEKAKKSVKEIIENSTEDKQ